MGFQTEKCPSHGLKHHQQSYYNANDYHSSEENYSSNYGSSMQMTKPYGYPSVTTPPPSQHHMMSHGGYNHDYDSWYNKDKYQSGYGQHSYDQYGHMSHDSADLSNNSSSMFHTDSGYGSGMQQYSSHASGGCASGMQQHSSHASGGYGSGMQHSTYGSDGYGSGKQHSYYGNGGYGSGMQHSSYKSGGYGSGTQHSSHSPMFGGLEHDSSKFPGHYEHSKTTDMWTLRSLDD